MTAKDETEKDLLTLIAGLERGPALDTCRSIVDGWLMEAGGGRLDPSMRRWTRIPNESRDFKRSPDGKSASFSIKDTSTDRLLLVTPTHQYSIRVSPDYLGCSVISRLAQPGEDWLRGSDLHDGKFNRITWEHILRDIFAYELVEIPRPAEGWNCGVAMFAPSEQKGDPTATPAAGAPLLSPEVATPFEQDTMSHEDPVKWGPGACGIDWCRLNRIHIQAPDTCSRCVNGCHPPHGGCNECPPEKAYEDEHFPVGGHLPR